MPNQLKYDPTRTTMLRRKFIADMQRRFKKISKAIQVLVVDDDVFGLEGPAVLQVRQAWRFRTDAQKVQEFRKWLQQQVDAGILSPVGGISGKPWTAPYIESAYRKGGLRAYTDLRREELANYPSLFEGGQEEFIRTAFGQPEVLHKIELLYERAFTELKDVTTVMGQQMSRTLAEGLAQGYGPRKIARNLRKTVSNITKTRANVIARTEIIRAHAEGQLDSFERLGVEELELMAEWSTAGDERVCAECGELEGVVMTVKEARGLIPRHPNCRCAWIPASSKRKEKGQLWGRDKDRAIEKSIQAESPKKIKRTAAEVKRRSTWVGKELGGAKKIKRVEPKPKPEAKLKKVERMKPGGRGKMVLLQKEKFAIQDYTSDKFLELNRKLRSGIKLEGSEKELLKNLSSGLEKLPVHKGDVFRKISFSSEKDLNKFISEHSKGNIVSYNSPVSTSTDNRRFLFSGKGDVNITIKGKTGKNISAYSKNEVEKEVLFDRNRVFKVSSIKRNDINAYDIHLEELLE